ncbi:hypothetical protein PW5551_09595 [Petrotoga sp. 9PW.55.5.1]|jgi:hypothetical protein|uniref:hypothetical protein n=1 Tax=Petrotoga sp. 9PW.55.5.1 TaxID=1308979 RepID=UPI000DC21D28|nr:hypothetical protein [Petrotoga sp. 9PW.55.5.1]RAO98460.1 hypothetical protein PW5551_09595 [Petrotoga sp. 9PW.55.5.1]
MKTKIKSLIIIFIILFSTLVFSIEANTTVPIYLEVPEYLEITFVSKQRLDLYADIFDMLSTVEDSLTFKVLSNVNYNLQIDFSVLGSLSILLKSLIENNYRILIFNSEEAQIINTEYNNAYVNTPGIHNYTLFFQLDVGFFGSIIYNFTEGKIGDMYITVSSI